MTDLSIYAYPELKPLDQDWRWCHRYAHDVVTGKILSCKWIRLACQRHLDDLERDDVYFDVIAAKSIVKWFELIPLTDATGFQATILLPWQIFLVCCLIAWKREDIIEDDEGELIERLGTFTYRRFDRAFVLVGRKNGKTTLIAGVMLYVMYKSPFMRPRAFSLATKMEQAREVWFTAYSMILMSPELMSVFKPRANDILMPSRNGSFVPLPNDSKSLDGKNPLVASLDECHALKDAKLYGVIGSAFGAQEEGLFITITTAGFVLDGICVTLQKNGKKCLDKSHADHVDQDNYFYLLYQIEIDKEQGRDKDGKYITDDWQNEKVWIKANPGMGYQPSVRYLRNQCREAGLSSEEKGNFITKHCNLFVSGAHVWLDMDEVRSCRVASLDLNQYVGRKCTVGFDRSLVNDITSLCLLFPTDNGGADAFYINLLPEDAIKKATDNLKQTYQKAIEAGHLEVIPGAVIKNSHVRPYFKMAKEDFDVDMFGYDPYKMKEIALELEDEGYPMVHVGQGVGNMSEPAKKLEELLKDKTFSYNDNLFEFACTNAIQGVTKFGNVAIYRENVQTEKIDPLIATIIALSCATLQKVATNPYDDRGML